MTKYEDLIRRAEKCHRAAMKANDPEARAIHAAKYYKLVEKARSLTLKEAAEKV